MCLDESRCVSTSLDGFCCHCDGTSWEGLRQVRFSGTGPTGPTGHDWPSPPVLQAIRPERLDGYALSNRDLGCALPNAVWRWRWMGEGESDPVAMAMDG